MKLRCRGAKPQWQKDYVDRGITYDPSWDSFETFLSDMGEPPEGMSLDRIDNDGPYCKDNCRWADRITQRHNSRGLRRVTVNGELLILAVAVRKYSSVCYLTVLNRILLGWPEEEAVLAPKCNRWSRRSNKE